MNNIEFLKRYKEHLTIKSLPNELKCSYCETLLIEPYYLNCKHNYCLDCINKISAQDKISCKLCPENNKDSQILINRLLIKKIKEIQINCLNSQDCSWKGNYISFENHCNLCGFIIIPCDLNCGTSIIRNELENHKFNICEERFIRCAFCNTDEKFKNYKNHLKKECFEIPVDCPNLCITNHEITLIKKKDLKSHIDKCPNQIISCEVCNQFEKRNQIDNHIKESIYSHMLLINNAIKFLIKEKDNQNCEISDKIELLQKNFKEEINMKDLEIAESRKKIELLEKNFKQEKATLELEISKNKQKIELLEKSLKEEKAISIQFNKFDLKNDSVSKKITLNHKSKVWGLLHFSEDRLISGGHKDIKYWNLDNNTLISSILDAHDSYITCLRKFNEKQFLSGSMDNTIKIWDFENRELIRSFIEHTNSVWDVLVLSTKKIASAGWDNLIKIWDFEKKNSRITLTGHTDYVRGLIEMKEDEIISCSDDEKIKFWDLTTNQNTKTLEPETDDIISLLKISHSQFASGSKEIILWDYPSCNRLRTIKSEYGSVLNMILLDCNIFASVSGSNDKKIRFWNFLTGESIKIMTESTDGVNRLLKLNERDIACCGDHNEIIILKNYKKIK